uniref:Uncharacterized protein n=1 Tax=Pristhesancus plagipennis TaxID=1955184 RepID=A0A2K8JPL8_PRIPG|nr:secreted hypothetical protein [Pristhesancus plagipennis]
MHLYIMSIFILYAQLSHSFLLPTDNEKHNSEIISQVKPIFGNLLSPFIEFEYSEENSNESFDLDDLYLTIGLESSKKSTTTTTTTEEPPSTKRTTRRKKFPGK